MAKILLKRGEAENLTATLDAGEPAFTTDTGKLYVGDGSLNLMINPDNVPSATKLATPRTISLSGDVTGSANFDGTANAPITATLAGSGVTAGIYPKVTVDSKGRVTAGSALSASDIPALTLAKISNAGTAAAANTGTASGNVPVLDSSGHVASSTLPFEATASSIKANGTQSVGSLGTAARADHVHPTDTSRAPVASPTFTGTVTLPTSSPSDSLEAASKGYVDTVLGNLSGGMIFKGTLGTGGTITALPASGYRAGWTYRVVSAGTYAGQACEVGDLVIAVKDYASAYADADWTVSQTNIDGALTAYGTLTANTVPVIHGAHEIGGSSISLTNLSNTVGEYTGNTPTAGTYKSVTINGHGRVTAGTNPTTLAGYGITDAASSASPVLTGTPTAPTAASGTNTTQIATTAFVHAALQTIDGGTF